MKVLRRLLDFYVNSSIHVALAVCSLVVITLFEFDTNVSKALLFFIFFGTITGYNFIKYAKIAGLHHRSLAKSLKSIQIFSVIAAILMSYAVFQLSLKTLWVIGVLGISTFLYAVPFFYKKSFRDVEGLKIFIVAFVWATVTVILPFIENGDSLGRDIWITFFQRFILVLVLVFPFEIRDLPYDSPSLKTLAQRLGVIKLKLFGYFLLVGVILIELLKTDVYLAMLIPLILLNISIGSLLYFSETSRSKYYTTLWVEGIPIFWLGLQLLFRYLFL